MPKGETNLKVLKSAVNAVLDHQMEDLAVENVTIKRDGDSYWDCPYPEMHNVSMQPADLPVGQLSDDVDFVELIHRGQSADISYNLVQIAPLLGHIGETTQN